MCIENHTPKVEIEEPAKIAANNLTPIQVFNQGFCSKNYNISKIESLEKLFLYKMK
jgi:hypothetical protein